jgi:hypothetical protein
MELPDRVRWDGGRRRRAGRVLIEAPTRAAVDAFHVAALEAGGRDDGAPGLRPRYGARYHAALVVDPDGHKREAVHQ